jgi:hypothetical protein
MFYLLGLWVKYTRLSFPYFVLLVVSELVGSVELMHQITANICTNARASTLIYIHLPIYMINTPIETPLDPLFPH